MILFQLERLYSIKYDENMINSVESGKDRSHSLFKGTIPGILQDKLINTMKQC